MKKGIFVFILFTGLVFNANAQPTDTTSKNVRRVDKHLSLLLGYNIQQHSFAEAGLGIHSSAVTGVHPFNACIFLGNEFKLGSNFVIGPKIGAWTAGGMSGLAMGLSLINYLDFKTSALRLRPEIGLGGDYFKLVYGYNFALGNSNFEGINTHNFGLVAVLNLKKIKNNKTK